MSRLVRLYPAAWRARYGDELAALLEDDPPSPFDTLDLLLGALDAHRHLRGPGRLSDDRKGIPMTLRLAGSAAVLGGGLWIAMIAAFAYISMANLPDGDGAPLFVLVVGAQLALLVALAGLSAFQADRHRGLVWFAFLVPATGAVVSLVGLAGMALRPDEELVAGLSGWAIWSLGMMATIVGAGLFGAVTYLTAALSRTGALVLTGGATLGIVSIAFGVFGGPDQAMGPLLLVLGSVVLGAGWIMLGLDAVRRDVPRKVELPA